MRGFCKTSIVGIAVLFGAAGCTGDSPTTVDSDASSATAGEPGFSLLQPPVPDTTPFGGFGTLAFCDPLLAVEPCPEEDPGGGGPFGLLISGNWFACTGVGVSDDFDNDGLSDSCEFALAFKFAPQLLTSNEAFLGRETYWAVDPAPAAGTYSVRIFYALGYYDDKEHKADSEFITIDVESVGLSNLWATQTVYLSAHWGTPADRSGSTQRSDYDAWVNDVLGGRPVVWVAEGKHANYISSAVCNFRLLGDPYAFKDNCDATPVPQDVEVLASANLGSRGTQLISCIATRSGNVPAHPGTECFWNGFNFRGWYNNISGKTGYSTTLAARGF